MNRLALVAVFCVQVACLWHVSSGADNAGIAIVKYDGPNQDSCPTDDYDFIAYAENAVCSDVEGVFVLATDYTNNQTITMDVCVTGDGAEECACADLQTVGGEYGFCSGVNVGTVIYVSAWPIETVEWTVNFYSDVYCAVPLSGSSNGTYEAHTCGEAPGDWSEDVPYYFDGGLLATTSGPSKFAVNVYENSTCGGDVSYAFFSEENVCFPMNKTGDTDVYAFVSRSGGSGSSSSTGSGGPSSSTGSGGSSSNSTGSGGSSSNSTGSESSSSSSTGSGGPSSSTGSGGSSSSTGSGGSSSSSSGSSSSLGFRLSDFFFMLTLAVGAASFTVVSN